jgi:hypothetical protein
VSFRFRLAGLALAIRTVALSCPKAAPSGLCRLRSACEERRAGQHRQRDCHGNLAPAEREWKGWLLFKTQSPPANSETLRL